LLERTYYTIFKLAPIWIMKATPKTKILRF